MENLEIKRSKLPEFQESGTEIYITLGNGEICIIDATDRWIVENFGSFQKTKNHVTCERIIRTDFSSIIERIYVHRLVMHAGIYSDRPRLQVDHKNRNPLDNRRTNLRWASPRQNAANCIQQTISNTGYRGVTDTQKSSKRNLKKRFVAVCSKKNLGYYMTAEEAARAYDAHAKLVYGEFAILNFPEPEVA